MVACLPVLGGRRKDWKRFFTSQQAGNSEKPEEPSKPGPLRPPSSSQTPPASISSKLPKSQHHLRTRPEAGETFHSTGLIVS